MVVKVKSNALLLCTWHYQPQYHRALELLRYAPLAKPQKWWTDRGTLIRIRKSQKVEVKVQAELQLEFDLKQCIYICQLQRS